MDDLMGGLIYLGQQHKSQLVLMKIAIWMNHLENMYFVK